MISLGVAAAFFERDTDEFAIVAGDGIASVGQPVKFRKIGVKGKRCAAPT